MRLLILALIPTGKIYWTDSGTGNPTPMQDDKIQRANLDGSNPEALITCGLINPQGIALMLTP